MKSGLTARDNIKQFVKFTFFSCSAGAIEAIAFSFLEIYLHFTYWPAYLIALILSVVYNFTLNRRYTFMSNANVPVAMLKLTIYYCIFTPVTTIAGDWLTTGLHWNDFVVLFIMMVLNLITEFLVNRIFIYPKSMNTNSIAVRKQQKSPSC